MPEQQKIQIKCPNCGMPYQANVQSIIDVGQNPELRRALLSGQFNVAVCPNCKTPVGLEVPLLYHDPAAEFLGVYMPPQASMPEIERQKIIGDMTQTLMRSLPPEKRKGYFLNPRQFINRQSFMDAIMGTMGVTQEELDRQRRKMKLLEQAMVMVDDPKGLQLLVKQHDADLDYEFFMMLTNVAEQAGAGDDPEAEKLSQLRERLMALTTWGKRMARQEAAVASLDQVKTPAELLDKITSAEPDEVDAIAVAARPLLDYAFFQALTDKIETSRGPEKDRLTLLRERLLTITQQLDAATRETLRSATELLGEILNSPNPRTALREHADQVDDVFMAVLSLNIQEAEKQAAHEAMARLEMIYDEILVMAEENMPPEVRLINELMRAPYPDGTRALLKEHQGELSSQVMSLMDELSQQLAERDDSEAAKRLKDIKTQAMLLV
jgi:hypothetical protein